MCAPKNNEIVIGKIWLHHISMMSGECFEFFGHVNNEWQEFLVRIWLSGGDPNENKKSIL